jgi:hypothetical protein
METLYIAKDMSTVVGKVILCAKVSSALRRVMNLSASDSISDSDKGILEKGATFLGTVLKGAYLAAEIEDRAFSPSFEGLNAYEKALTALEQLQELAKEDQIAEYFRQCYDDLLALSNAELFPSESSIRNIYNLFKALCNVFDLEGRQIERDFTPDSPSMFLPHPI